MNNTVVYVNYKNIQVQNIGFAWICQYFLDGFGKNHIHLCPFSKDLVLWTFSYIPNFLI